MAKFTTTAVLLFFLFTLSYARIPLNLQRFHDSTGTDSPYIYKDESFLLDENHDPAKIQPTNTNSKLFLVKGHSADPIVQPLPELDVIHVDSIPRGRPLDAVGFRPVINGHVRSFPHRISRRQHRSESKTPCVEVSYGDDMILSTENDRLDSSPFGNGIHRVPVVRVRSESEQQQPNLNKEGTQRFWSRRDDRFGVKKLEKEREKHTDLKERKDLGGFLMRFRKFLINNF